MTSWNGHHWTTAEDDRLREMWRAGDDMRIIGIRLGLSVNQIGRRRGFLGLPPRPKTPPKPESSWTEERIVYLTDNWDRLSASKIAEDLGDTTRSAVCGKAHRLGLAKPTKSSLTRARKRTEAFDGAPIEEPGGPVVVLLKLEANMCRWPIGHPGQEDFGFCGARTAPGKSYCGAHHATSVEQASPAVVPKRRQSVLTNMHLGAA